MVIKMKIIEINGIGGLYYEFYTPINLEDLNYDNADIFFKNWNGIFWKNMLSVEIIDKLWNLIYNQKEENLSIWEKAVLYNKDAFKENVRKATEKIISYTLTKEELFGVLETLSVHCRLLSKYIFPPFVLDLQEGIRTGYESSFIKLYESLEIATFCKSYLAEMMEPHLTNVDFIWINGRLNYTNLLAIYLFRQRNPNVFVGLRYHESEYFSYNKIEDYLKENYPLFDLIDCIVLDNFKDTMNQVENNYSDPQKLRNIGNIIFKNHINGKIERTKLKKNVYQLIDYLKMPFISNHEKRMNISPVINMRLNANKYCYWHKCAFCGINQKYKYHFSDLSLFSILEAINIVEKYAQIGYTYFWFEDEAIEKRELIDFATKLIEKEIHIFWQVRTRFDNTYSFDECKLLYDAGLREIRFGYESGDVDVLKSMNKYPEDFDYNLIEQNIRAFSTAEIHVHLPVILGFPTETSIQRSKTIEELKRLHKMYDVSFNLNRFLLDISSDTYKNFYKYKISELHLPTAYDDYIGNFGFFNRNKDIELIEKDRLNIMREVLYSWMPTTSLLSSVIFYRLSEASRMTLLWAVHNESKSFKPRKGILNPNISIIPDERKVIIYVWDNHYIISYDRAIFNKIEACDFSSLSPQIINESYEKKVIL